jgi:hypothetical protein
VSVVVKLTFQCDIMPRKSNKRNVRRPRNRQSKRSENYFGQFGNDVRSGLRVARTAVSMFNTEIKNNDIANTNALVSTNVIVSLSALLQGNTRITREGSSVKWTSHSIDYTMNTATNVNIRLMLILDLQPNGALPIIGDLLQNVSSAAYIQQSPYNILNKGRFVPLLDKIHVLDASSKQNMHARFALQDVFHTLYNDGVAGTVADINTNDLVLVICSWGTVNYSYIYRGLFVDN